MPRRPGAGFGNPVRAGSTAGPIPRLRLLVACERQNGKISRCNSAQRLFGLTGRCGPAAKAGTQCAALPVDSAPAVSQQKYQYSNKKQPRRHAEYHRPDNSARRPKVVGALVRALRLIITAIVMVRCPDVAPHSRYGWNRNRCQAADRLMLPLIDDRDHESVEPVDCIPHGAFLRAVSAPQASWSAVSLARLPNAGSRVSLADGMNPAQPALCRRGPGERGPAGMERRKPTEHGRAGKGTRSMSSAVSQSVLSRRSR